MRLSRNVGQPCTVPRHCTCVKSRHLAVGRQFFCRADMRIVAIPGALRAGSTNNGLLRAAAQVLPSGVHMVQADYSQLPLYNDDLWTTGIPDSVKTFRDHIQSADALLFAVPEYNYSLPGPLKNAIDWASKNPNVFAGKPATMLGQCCCCSLSNSICMLCLTTLHNACAYAWLSAACKSIDVRTPAPYFAFLEALPSFDSARLLTTAWYIVCSCMHAS